MTSFTLNLISVKVSFHDIFKKTLNITPVNITSCTVVSFPKKGHIFSEVIKTVSSLGERSDPHTGLFNRDFA